MYLETEMYTALIICFSIIISIGICVSLVLYYKTRNNKILYFVMQHFFLIPSFYYFYKALLNYPNIDHPMYSEQQTMYLVISGGLWSLSMICMLIGTIAIFKQPKNNAN